MQVKHCLLLCCSVGLWPTGGYANALPDTATDTPLDWQPLSPELQARLNPSDQVRLCGGYYQAKPMDAKGLDTEQSVLIEADQVSYALAGQARIQGDVRVYYGAWSLQTESAELDLNQARIDLPVPVELRQSQLALRAHSGYSLAEGEAGLNEAEFVLHQQHLRGQARKIQRFNTGEIRLQDGYFTSCSPYNTSWALAGEDIRLDPVQGRGSAKHVRLELAGTPAFYLPYMSFPLDDRRHTGLLAPRLGYTNGRLDVLQPIYLNLAPHYDATLMPRFMEGRGWLIGGEMRYLWSNQPDSVPVVSQLEYQHLNQDPEYQQKERWLLGVMHTGGLGSRWRYHLEYREASDVGFFDDFGDDLASSSVSELPRLAELSYWGQDWRVQARIQGYQVLEADLQTQDKPYYRLPQIRASTEGFWGAWEYQLHSELVYFWREQEDLADTGYLDAQGRVHWGTDTRATRLQVRPSVGLPLRYSWGYIHPQISLDMTQYWIQNAPQSLDTQPQRAVPMYTLDAGLLFERSTHLWGRDYRQTLEPRAFYAYVPYRDQTQLPLFDTEEKAFDFSQLYSVNRFTGQDRIGDEHRLTLGTSSRFLDETSGREVARLGIAQVLHFADRRVQAATDPELEQANALQDSDKRSRSGLAGMLAWRPSSGWRLSHEVLWDEREQVTERATTRIGWRSSKGHLLNLAYRLSDANTADTRLEEQVDFSIYYKANLHWGWFGGWRHDLEGQEPLERLLGFEYDACCWKTQVLYRSWQVDDTQTSDPYDYHQDKGIFVRFVLKGLGGVGQDTGGFLQGAIAGYRDQEQ
ncbi:LPS-assembly protein [Allopseudospirillum japonicum]|uniref:LPS-assembly protein LptD n=1 Tax=Allopseudospirillum japonicum TaxID=64971 RepID=A0A1H6TG38_9GAMM|nr:LPS-assembly protein LptD [Allopseudospirillum japonicum]SEI74742.1 LPS-assembly protein [Allopseudospirillum japonicum]